MKKYSFIFATSLLFFISSVMANTVCGCSSGEMTASIGKDGKVTLTCSGGGQVQCEVDVIH